MLRTNSIWAAGSIGLLLSTAVLVFVYREGTADRGMSGALKADRMRDCRECPEMVVIRGGQFVMGITAEDQERERVPPVFRARTMPLRTVTVPAFALGAFPVTLGEFEAFADETGFKQDSACHVYLEYENNFMPQAGYDWRNPRFRQSAADPVVCISWDDAQAYVQWLTRKTGKRYRLPTEAEWEFAARAGSTTSRYWGDSVSDACRYGNVADTTMYEALRLDRDPAREAAERRFQCKDGFVYTSPVGSFEPNAFGLFDMLGNVWQWAEDCKNDSYDGAPSDGSAWKEGDCRERVARGGAWYSLPFGIRSGDRNWDPTNGRYSDNGFRVARDL